MEPKTLAKILQPHLNVLYLSLSWQGHMIKISRIF